MDKFKKLLDKNGKRAVMLLDLDKLDEYIEKINKIYEKPLKIEELNKVYYKRYL